jgi:hypothetical protein
MFLTEIVEEFHKNSAVIVYQTNQLTLKLWLATATFPTRILIKIYWRKPKSSDEVSYQYSDWNSWRIPLSSDFVIEFFEEFWWNLLHWNLITFLLAIQKQMNA